MSRVCSRQQAIQKHSIFTKQLCKRLADVGLVTPCFAIHQSSTLFDSESIKIDTYNNNSCSQVKQGAATIPLWLSLRASPKQE